MGAAKDHELAGEEAEEDGGKDLEGEDVDRGSDDLAGDSGAGAVAVHAEPVLEGQSETRVARQATTRTMPRSMRRAVDC